MTPEIDIRGGVPETTDSGTTARRDASNAAIRVASFHLAVGADNAYWRTAAGSAY
jgi:hypothetical protein